MIYKRLKRETKKNLALSHQPLHEGVVQELLYENNVIHITLIVLQITTTILMDSPIDLWTILADS